MHYGHAFEVFSGVLPSHALSYSDTLVKASVIGLNYMHTGKRADLVDKPLNRCQHTTVLSLHRRWWHLASHLGKSSTAPIYDPQAFNRLVSRGAGGKAVPLIADRVASLHKCGAVNPAPLLPESVQKVITSLDTLIDVPSLLEGKVARFTSGSRAEYVKLVRRQCRSQKVMLGTTCKYSAPCFTVGKLGTDQQREILGRFCIQRCFIASASTSLFEYTIRFACP